MEAKQASKQASFPGGPAPFTPCADVPRCSGPQPGKDSGLVLRRPMAGCKTQGRDSSILGPAGFATVLCNIFRLSPVSPPSISWLVAGWRDSSPPFCLWSAARERPTKTLNGLFSANCLEDDGSVAALLHSDPDMLGLFIIGAGTPCRHAPRGNASSAELKRNPRSGEGPELNMLGMATVPRSSPSTAS